MITTNFSELNQYLVILLPLFIIQIGLMIFAIIDLIRREKVRGQKWIWALVILFINVIGPIIYFLAGREDE
jgi:uncharacterized membrane protein YhaH (DUF805 family)